MLTLAKSMQNMNAELFKGEEGIMQQGGRQGRREKPRADSLAWFCFLDNECLEAKSTCQSTFLKNKM